MPELEVIEKQLNKPRRKGQTLAEFAISLPILLILVFGIIEFGRIYQAWVTLQNSARNAARYATTGAYNPRFFNNDTGVDDNTDETIVPCLYDDFRGSPVADEHGVLVYNGDEGLFATWYDGRDCRPDKPEDQYLRKDILRLLSIYEQARVGAAGLAIGGTNWLTGVEDTDTAAATLYDVWNRPLPAGQNLSRAGSDQAGWFDVMVCSTRKFIESTSSPVRPPLQTRFIMAINKTGPTGDSRAPACIMNERPTVDGLIDNSDHAWLDAGGPGDTVVVVVTFNHPLVTPLGLAPYVQLQARRSAVNEAFRVANALDALPPGGNLGPKIPQPPVAIIQPVAPLTLPQGSTIDTLTAIILDGSESYDPDSESPLIYSWRSADNVPRPNNGGEFHTVELKPGSYTFYLIVTDDQGLSSVPAEVTVVISLPIPPEPPTSTYTPVPSVTPIPPFDCELLTVADLSFFNNRVFIQIQNENVFETQLTRAILGWRTLSDYPDMAVSSFALDNIIHWNGRDRNPNTDTNADIPSPADIFLNAERTIGGESQHTWEGVFASGPASLSSRMTIYDFAGTEFHFANPTDQNAPCIRRLNIPTPTPSPTFDVNQPPPTATWTPDCAGVLVDVRFVEFRTFGVAVLSVTNRRSNVAVFTDFQINWIQRAPGQMTLERVTVGGSGPSDSVTPTTMVWQSGSASQDSTPPTTGGSTVAGREGNWLQNYSFPPNSITPLYIDFGGTTTTLPAAFGVAASGADFNGTWFEIGCGVSGGSGGNGGGGASGRINLFNENTPVPTNTPGPTQPPPPTFTPSRTWTPGPPTNTPSPRPPTNTPQATNTQAPPPTNTLPPMPTIPGSGGSDGDN